MLRHEVIVYAGIYCVKDGSSIHLYQDRRISTNNSIRILPTHTLALDARISKLIVESGGMG